MKRLILARHIITLTDNGRLEIDETQHSNVNRGIVRNDKTILLFDEVETRKISELLKTSISSRCEQLQTGDT